MDLVQTLNAIIDKKIKDCSVALPAIVTAVDTATQTVTVKTGIFDAEFESAIEIEAVECLQLCMSDHVYLYQPIAVGTQGIILVMDRSSSPWFNGSSATPQKSDGQRYHDLSDAVFIPGLQQQRLACEPTTAGTTELKNGNMRIALHPSGKIEIEGTTQEMLTVIASFMDHAKSFIDAIVNDAHAGAAVHALATGWAANPLNTNIAADITNFKTLKV